MKKPPDALQWLLTAPWCPDTLELQPTEWPFPVSIEASGSVLVVSPPATRAVPLPDEPALF